MSVIANLTPAPNFLKPRRALLSVSDKTGLVKLAQRLARAGVELISTGGTARALNEAGLEVKDVSHLTGFPEILDGRVKTLHPNVHGGLLGIHDDPNHAAACQEHGIQAIDLLVVNLYPFEQVSQSGADFATVLENIDIGGPAMIRAAAKNHAYCTVLTDPQDYEGLFEELENNDGQLSLDFRRHLAAQAFARIAEYDVAIAVWFGRQNDDGEVLPPFYGYAAKRKSLMRYGENPHQKGAFYLDGTDRAGVASAQIIQGKPLSYNNIADGDAAFELVSEFDQAEQAAVAIIKHANPCGVGVGKTVHQAYLKALGCDPTSAFGGIVALNRELDEATALEIVKIFTEVIIAPQASAKAREILAAKPNLRLLVTGKMPDPAASGWVVRSVAGGFLMQTRDNVRVDALDLRVVTKRAPTPAEWQDLKFAFSIAKHVKSNAIVYAKDGATVGIGAGQMSRLDSARIAAIKAQATARVMGTQPAIQGSVVASDAFFPFADGLHFEAKKFHQLLGSYAARALRYGFFASKAAVSLPASQAEEIGNRLMTALSQEAEKLLNEGVARNQADIDAIMVKNYGFSPEAGGPLFWLKEHKNDDK